jgi:phage FluMu gp28-like protein
MSPEPTERRVRLALATPHVRQTEVIKAAKRFNVVDCGRRWGKTELGIYQIIKQAITTGTPCAWFAPSYKQLAPVWRDLQNRLTPVQATTSQMEHRLGLIGGGSIEMWSLDSPDAGRGRAYARVIIDEAALVANLKEAWEQSIRPMLTDYRGDAWFLSTPKGIASYFHDLYRRGSDPLDAEWASWQMPSSSNPFIPAGEIESARADMTDLAFAQEYMAQFVSWEGSVFRCILDAVYDPPEPPRGVVLIGVDWGRTSDFTVFVGLDAHGRVLATDRFRGVEYSIQRDRLQAFWMCVSNGRSWILAEVNSMGGPVVEQLQRDGMPVVAFQTTNASKCAAIEALALAFERGTVKIPRDTVFIGELQAYEGRRLPSGMTQYGAPKGDNSHDDMVMALAIAWSGYEAAQNRRPDRIWADTERGGYSIESPGPVEISPY